MHGDGDPAPARQRGGDEGGGVDQELAVRGGPFGDGACQGVVVEGGFGGGDGLPPVPQVQARVPHVADDDRPTGRDDRGRGAEHLGQVGQVGEALRHGVDHHAVRCPPAEGVRHGGGPGLVRGGPHDRHPVPGGGAVPIDDVARDVGAHVGVDVRGDPFQQHPGAAAQLQHPARTCGEHELGRAVGPLPHVRGGQRRAGTRGPPPGQR